MDYKSDIEMGAKYKDILTGFEGRAIYVSFHITGCTRVGLETEVGEKDKAGDLKIYEFDETRLTKLAGPSAAVKKLAKKVEANDPGGPTTSGPSGVRR